MLFLDSNVVLYGLDPRDPAKQRTCLAWLRMGAKTRSITLSPQVCAEVRNAAVRKLRISPNEANTAVLRLLPWCTAPYGSEEIRRALTIVDTWRTSWWDALLMASAIGAGCTHFLTEDGQAASVIEGVRLINPFTTAPEDVLGAA